MNKLIAILKTFVMYKLASINVLACTWLASHVMLPTRAWLRSKKTVYLSEQDLFVDKYFFKFLAKKRL